MSVTFSLVCDTCGEGIAPQTVKAPELLDAVEKIRSGLELILWDCKDKGEDKCFECLLKEKKKVR